MKAMAYPTLTNGKDEQTGGRMTPDGHRITTEQVLAIADGTGGDAELAILTRSQRSKTLAMLELVVRQATAIRHPDSAAADSGQNLFIHVQHEVPAAAEKLLRYPAVGAWALETLLALRSPAPERARPGRITLIAAAAAVHGRVRASLEIPAAECQGSSLHLPSLGSIHLPSGKRGQPVFLRTQAGTVSLRWDDTTTARFPIGQEADRGWRPLTTITTGTGLGTLQVILDDSDPWRLPGYSESLSILTTSESKLWRRRLDDGWRLLTLHHQRTSADIQALIGTVSPLGSADGGRRSTTSRYAFGTVGLSLPDDEVTMALALAHEVQHVKLCALMDIVPLVNDQPGPGRRLYYAPWRSDPRPLASLLHGLYAHIGVTRFWRKQRDMAEGPDEAHRARIEFARWRAACTQVIGDARTQPELTRFGAVFVRGIARSLNKEYLNEHTEQ